MRSPLAMAWAMAGLGVCSLFSAAAAADCRWPAWERFRDTYVSAEGRVVDAAGTPPQRSVSEGQAYALFFALVADDRETFARLLRWTETEMAAGDLTAHLPAWLWGRRDDDGWGVLDDNAASDADLWIAYALAEAGQRWNQRHYRVLSALFGRVIHRDEVRTLPGLGPTLLPAPRGFDDAPGQWRLNPSYVPLQVLRGLDRLQPGAGWAGLLPSSRRLLLESAPAGFAPDWARYDTARGFIHDDKSERDGYDGSYDAIRVYLWAGMLDAGDPDRAALLARYRPMADATAKNGAPPEFLRSDTGAQRGTGNASFSASLLPLLRTLDMNDALDAQRRRVDAADVGARADAYFGNVLTLFGRGWDEGWFRFAADGRLIVRDRERCEALP